VVVVNDGSTDATEAIALEYPFRVVSTGNGGLSSARNVGLAAATGEVVAYIDDDAFPDPDWLRYLAASLAGSSHAGVGGPNLAPAGDGFTARCVAMAPGGPIHVLLSDREAEHIPGCNMAFRKEALVAVGGFDPRFRVAGDDVDVCWRLQDRGWTLGFSPSAVVWHHRRSSVRGYWRQQVGYGRAEALLEGKWPEKYNGPGHLTWGGRVYGGSSRPTPGLRRGRIYQGVWGTAPFQSVRAGRRNPLSGWPQIPEWYLALAALATLGVLGAAWRPLLVAWGLVGLGLVASVGWAAVNAARVVSARPVRSGWEALRLWSVTAALHLVQPLARLRGRLSLGLSPWRRARAARVGMPRPGRGSWWRERWTSGPTTVETIERALRSHAVPVLRGGPFDGWDLEARGGALGGARLLVAVEEHGGGRQLVRCRWWPVPARSWLLGSATLVAATAWAVLDGAWEVTPFLGTVGLSSAGAVAGQCAGAVRAVRSALVVLEEDRP
jgi:O-antigen biosynthesis protein